MKLVFRFFFPFLFLVALPVSSFAAAAMAAAVDARLFSLVDMRNSLLGATTDVDLDDLGLKLISSDEDEEKDDVESTESLDISEKFESDVFPSSSSSSSSSSSLCLSAVLELLDLVPFSELLLELFSVVLGDSDSV